MSDYLMRGLRAQVTSSMDAVLRRAVFEIMMIFENSLRDHQMELAQRGEEVAQLKIKLQRAEIRLSEFERGVDKETEVKKGPPGPVLNTPEQTPDVPEIDFEVPDDWCAPLGCDTMVKQEEGICPSVRLRPLSIPLWPISQGIMKQEVANRGIDSRQQTKGLRRSRRGSSLNERLEHQEQEPRRPPLRNDVKKLLHDIKQGYTDPTDGIGVRGKGKHLTVKVQENTTKSKTEEVKTAETEEVESDGEKKYTCKFCKKEFDTMFGRSVHVRSHKKCKGCKKEFPFPSALLCHKSSCGKLKKLLAKKAQSANPPKPESCDEEKPTAPTKKEVIVEEKSAPSSSNHSESSVQKDGPAKKHSCVHCNKSFRTSWKMKEHMRIHTGERPFNCSMCPKTFRINQALKLHVIRMHHDKTYSSKMSENLAWTKPLEETEDTGEAVTSPRKHTNRAIGHNNVQKEVNPDRPSSRWQTMGKRCPDGFICILCHKVSKDKYQLIEHFRTHTGEKPLKCNTCPAVFRSRGQLSMHKKKHHKPIVNRCAKCDKTFHSQKKRIKHESHCHRDKPMFCNVCGKGFFTKGRLRNHVERVHK